MKITVCVGSACHLKGSKYVIERLEECIQENNLQDSVSLSGSFCFGRCVEGVSVSVGDTVYSVLPETVDEFFNSVILKK